MGSRRTPALPSDIERRRYPVFGVRGMGTQGFTNPRQAWAQVEGTLEIEDPRMRLLTRYILREVSSHAVLGGVLFTFVLFMRDLSKILELVVRDSAGVSDVIRIILYTLPNAFTVTIPMAILVGILLGLSRLAADSEITAMRASGMGALEFVRVVSIVSTVGLALGLVNSIVLAPRAASSLLALQDSLKSSQASFEVQPRVFYEDFRNYVLYVQDVRPAAGTALWQHVFLADLSQPGSPQITTAQDAVVVSEPVEKTAPAADESTGSGPGIHLHMIHGTQHQLSATDPNQYDVSTFHTTDIPIQTSVQDDTHVSRMDTPLHALSLREAYRLSRVPGADAGGRPPGVDVEARRPEQQLRDDDHPGRGVLPDLVGRRGLCQERQAVAVPGSLVGEHYFHGGRSAAAAPDVAGRYWR